jgi:hypothetical protein
MQGYAWDIWPAVTGAGTGRIATGHAGTVAAAQEIVEQLLATNEDGSFGILTKPDLTALVCRRGRILGSFMWYPLRGWAGEHPAEPVDTADAAGSAV